MMKRRDVLSTPFLSYNFQFWNNALGGILAHVIVVNYCKYVKFLFYYLARRILADCFICYSYVPDEGLSY